MLVPLEKSQKELQLPRLLSRTMSGQLRLVARVDHEKDTSVDARAEKMLSLANKFMGEGPFYGKERVLFGFRLAKEIVGTLREGRKHLGERVADAFPYQSVAVEELLERVVLPNLTKLTSSEAIATLKLLAMVSEARGDSFHRVANHLRDGIQDLKPRSLLNLTLAYATFGARRDKGVFPAITEAVVRGSDGLTPSCIAGLMKGLSVSRYRDEKLFETLAAKVTSQMPFFSADMLAEVAMGFARLAIKDETFFDKLETDLLSPTRRKDRSSTAVVKLAWAVAAGAHDPRRVCSFIDQNPDTFKGLKSPYTTQLGQALLAIYPEHPEAKRLARSSRTPWATSRKDGSFKQKVRNILIDECGVKAQNISESLHIAGIESDLLATKRDRKVVVECNGDEYHRTWGPDGGTLLGKDLVQDRARVHLGYRIVHVLAFDLFGGNKQKVVAALRQALDG